MRKMVQFGALFLLLVSPAFSQTPGATLKIRVVMVDGDLNQKPVPRLLLKVERVDVPTADAAAIRTSFDGTAQVTLAPGRYRVSTTEGSNTTRSDMPGVRRLP